MVKSNSGAHATECACELIAQAEPGLLPSKPEADEFIAVSEQIQLGFACGSEVADGQTAMVRRYA